MPSTLVDLDDYFERIGHSHDYSPTLETLQQLYTLHTEAIAFETLSPFLGENVKIDTTSPQDKIVKRGRDSYCCKRPSAQADGFQLRSIAVRVTTPETLPRFGAVSSTGRFTAAPRLSGDAGGDRLILTQQEVSRFLCRLKALLSSVEGSAVSA